MNKEKTKKITVLLKKMYGNEPLTYLNYNRKKPYEFLFAVMLSARCKDEMVNKITDSLFKKYKNLESIADEKISVMEKMIKSAGFYHDKAKNLIACANELLEKYNGKVPDTVLELMTLPGVGRKTANVVISQLHNVPAMAVDTHVFRLANRIFNLNAKTPKEVEEYLCKYVDKKDWRLWNTHLIAHGRKVCIGQRPKCDMCILKRLCGYY